MSTMSDQARILDELRQEDQEILADIAYQQRKAMEEECIQELMQPKEKEEGEGERRLRVFF
jgi:hypothetical protein